MMSKPFHFEDLSGGFSVVDYTPDFFIVDISVSIKHCSIVNDLDIFEIGNKITTDPVGIPVNAEPGKLYEWGIERIQGKEP